MSRSKHRFYAAILVMTSGHLALAQPAPKAKAFVGSQACRTCHPAIYDRWRKTRMANVVLDPKIHPEAVLGDFSKPDPLVTFKLEDVAFIYGSKWKQRYFIKRGDDYFVAPAQWDVTNHLWRQYYVKPGTDWWVSHYPADQMERPTGPLCDGCHSVNYDPQTKTVTEWNVGCEKCHGPGGGHAGKPSRENIVNPARLDFVRAADVCIQCHSQGQPLTNPIHGKYFDWPVGFLPGERLAEVWRLEEHRLGETSFTHFAEGSAHKNRMQGNDFVTSVMHTRGVTCFGCHDVHGTANEADLLKPASAMCFECHGPQSLAGPRGSIAEHTHHKAGSAGGDCRACHMPRTAQTIADVSVRSHTFRFISPSDSELYKIPNPCTLCHKDRSNAWAAAQLRSWQSVSPWRTGQ
jgi:predicted CXXCH cytochrome family protein